MKNNILECHLGRSKSNAPASLSHSATISSPVGKCVWSEAVLTVMFSPMPGIFKKIFISSAYSLGGSSHFLNQIYSEINLGVAISTTQKISQSTNSCSPVCSPRSSGYTSTTVSVSNEPYVPKSRRNHRSV